MKSIFRSFQFLISGILLSIKNIIFLYSSLLIGLSSIIILILFIAVLFGSNQWGLIGKFLLKFLNLVIIIIIFEFLASKIGNIFGFFLSEKKENKKIFDEYFEYDFNQKYQYEKHKYNSNYTNYNYEQKYNYKDSIIERYIEYLKYFNIDINSDITPQKIKKAYKEIMKKIHPDKNPDKDTTKEAEKVNEMKEFLDINLEYYIMKRGNKNGY